MAGPVDRARRRFVGFCAGSVAAAAASAPRMAAAAEGRAVQPYREARLVRTRGRPLRAASLEPRVNYIFHYPYASTPCFLLDLGEPVTDAVELRTRADEPYVWRGGVGPGRSIVAFSAICSHRMTHPAPAVSFISYHPGGHHAPEDRGVIHCCSENSVYDPAAGARVLSGPAPEPLAAIELAHDERTDTLTAVGATGGTLFERFLDRFGHRLAMTYGERGHRRRVRGRTEVVTLDEFSRRRFDC